MTPRQTIKKEILDIVLDNRSDTIPQPLLVVGNEGTGKTFLVSYLDRKLKDADCKVLPFYYPHCDIVTADDIISPARDAAGKPVVVIIDDFDRLLQSLPASEQHRLRAMFIEKGAPTLVATSTGLLQGFNDYHHPFFGAFRVFHLPSPVVEDLPHLLLHQVYQRVKDNDGFLALLPRLDGNINYIRSVAGAIGEGLPVERALQRVANENERYFQQLFKSLSPVMQQALYALARAIRLNEQTPAGEPVAATSAHLLPFSRQSSANVASALFRLEKSGLIERVGEKRRGVGYRIKDYLLGRWLLPNDATSSPSPLSLH